MALLLVIDEDVTEAGSTQDGIASHETLSIKTSWAGAPALRNAKNLLFPGTIPKIAEKESKTVIEVVVKDCTATKVLPSKLSVTYPT